MYLSDENLLKLIIFVLLVLIVCGYFSFRLWFNVKTKKVQHSLLIDRVRAIQVLKEWLLVEVHRKIDGEFTLDQAALDRIEGAAVKSLEPLLQQKEVYISLPKLVKVGSQPRDFGINVSNRDLRRLLR